MGRPRELTKEYLQSLGVINVTNDGHVFTKCGELTIQEAKKQSRYKTQCYHTINLYDKNAYKLKPDQCGNTPLVLSRVMYAWFFDVCPANMDVDHINNNSLDDRLDNLQLLTRKENLAKRRGYMNQYENSYRE